MDKQTLQQVYPAHADKIIHDPMTGCPLCNGQGFYINAAKQAVPCICVVVKADEEKRLSIAAKTWEKLHPGPDQELGKNLQPLKEKIMQIKKHR